VSITLVEHLVGNDMGQKAYGNQVIINKILGGD